MPHYSYNGNANNKMPSNPASNSNMATKPTITRENVRASDIKSVDLVLHLNDQTKLVVRDVNYRPL